MNLPGEPPGKKLQGRGERQKRVELKIKDCLQLTADFFQGMP